MSKEMGAIQDALSSMCEDPRLSNDPLTSLAAVMRHHDMTFETAEGISVWGDNQILILDTDESSLTADNIKSEK